MELINKWKKFSPIKKAVVVIILIALTYILLFILSFDSYKEDCNWTPQLQPCEMYCGSYVYYDKEIKKCKDFELSSCCKYPDRRFTTKIECNLKCSYVELIE